MFMRITMRDDRVEVPLYLLHHKGNTVRTFPF